MSSKGWGWGIGYCGFGVWMRSCVVQRLGVGWIWCMDEELCRPKVGGGAQDIVDLV